MEISPEFYWIPILCVLFLFGLGQTEQVSKVEKMRQSILEGINLNRQAPPPLLPPPPFVPSMAAPFYPVPLYPRTIGSMPQAAPGRTRGFTGK